MSFRKDNFNSLSDLNTKSEAIIYWHLICYLDWLKLKIFDQKISAYFANNCRSGLQLCDNN